MAKAKKKKPFAELTLWDVILSYPDLHDPKPYKGKIYYQTDVLIDADHPQLSELRKAIKKVRAQYWGPDETEWVKPEKPLIQNGDKRTDQKGYKGRFFIVPKTQTPVPVVDLRGKAFNPQIVKGGMFANVAVRIAAWEYEGDEGVAIYLQGVMVDTKKKGLNFGGGKSVKQMFDLESEQDTDESDDADDSDEDDDSSKKKKPKTFKMDDDDDDDAEDDAPRKSKGGSSKKKSSRQSEQEEE